MTLPARIKREPKPEMPERIRSPGHLAWIRKHGCCVPLCNQRPIQAHHVRKGTDGAGSLKPGDQNAISLCYLHHSHVHNWGEDTFEARYAIDMKALAREFSERSPHRRKFLSPTPARR